MSRKNRMSRSDPAGESQNGTGEFPALQQSDFHTDCQSAEEGYHPV